MRIEMAKRRKQIQPQSGVEKAFGLAMRAARRRRKMSQMNLHVTTGLDRTFISDLERGIQCPSLVTIFRIAKGLKLDGWTLIKDTQESKLFAWPSAERQQSSSSI
jgi:transcriptional regulator with XRE-family HTH domain